MRFRHLVFAAALACGLTIGATATTAASVPVGSLAEAAAAEAPVEWARRRGRRYRGYRGYRSGYRRRYRSYRSYRSYRWRRGSYARRRGRQVEIRRQPSATTRVEAQPEARPESRGPRPAFDYGGVRR